MSKEGKKHRDYAVLSRNCREPNPIMGIIERQEEERICEKVKYLHKKDGNSYALISLIFEKGGIL
ncbi:hypothetical protein [Paenibacillus lautus]|uniref:Uncharacterized protein n=1 Tax=Paenibacillus lautus TaxID=1401 RepID=A0A385TNM1_PAELA|nr:hypothetical protein [Paenibacillus lautus]AYB45339.1 hypothetical protein D5F53_19475 [Paenibacillus lautus]MCI1775296.1 hypothetical protein [Paenibacillus lautus]